MARYYLFLFFLFCIHTSFAQNGINKLFAYEEEGTAFSSLLLDGDTLMVYGVAYNPNLPSQQGLLLSKFDTLGNLIAYDFQIDTSGNDFITFSNSPLLKLSNGGYAGVGSFFYGNTTYFSMYNKDGVFDQLKVYDDTTVRRVFQRLIVEVKDGFLITGYKQKQNYFLDIFLMKTNLQGNKLWEKSYGDPLLNEVCYSLVAIDENTFVIGGSRYSSVSLPIEDQWANAILITLDSTGELKSEWEANVDFNTETVIRGLQAMPDDGWMYTSNKTEVGDFGGFIFNPKIVRRDAQMNLLWEQNIPHTNGGNLFDLVPTPDNKYVALGEWVPLPNTGYADDVHGCLYKISSHGIHYWTSCHRRTWDTPDSTSREYLGGAVVLPSGSIIAAGRSDRRSPSPGQSYGWLIKVDANGCVDTLCNIIVAIAEAEVEKKGIKAFPNPASDKVVFELPNSPSKRKVLVIADINGSIVKEMIIGPEVLSIDWDVQMMANGIYFYRLISNGSSFSGGKIIVQH